MIIVDNHMVADEGKVFRRIGTEDILGEEIYLGYSHYIGGVKQDPPHKDEPEDFEEIDAPPDPEPEPEPEPDYEVDDATALQIILGNET